MLHEGLDIGQSQDKGRQRDPLRVLGPGEVGNFHRKIDQWIAIGADGHEDAPRLIEPARQVGMPLANVRVAFVNGLERCQSRPTTIHRPFGGISQNHRPGTHQGFGQGVIPIQQGEILDHENEDVEDRGIGVPLDLQVFQGVVEVPLPQFFIRIDSAGELSIRFRQKRPAGAAAEQAGLAQIAKMSKRNPAHQQRKPVQHHGQGQNHQRPNAA